MNAKTDLEVTDEAGGDATEAADESATDTAVSTATASSGDASVRPARRRLVPVLAGLVVILAIVGGYLGYTLSSTSGDLDSLRVRQADENAVLAAARTYTDRSLTYDFKNLDGFFAGVDNGASDQLKDRYSQVRPALSQIMTQSQVVAKGTVAAAAIASEADGTYTVSVFANQQTQNLQQANPATVPNLLTVKVKKIGGDWLVTDYGPAKS